MRGHVLHHITDEELRAACEVVLNLPPGGDPLALPTVGAALIVLKAARDESSIAAALAHPRFVQAVNAANAVGRAVECVNRARGPAHLPRRPGPADRNSR